MAKSQTKLPRLLLESAAIFLSVLLAFFVEQWREDLNERREAEDILNLVEAELTNPPLRTDLPQQLGQLVRRQISLAHEDLPQPILILVAAGFLQCTAVQPQLDQAIIRTPNHQIALKASLRDDLDHLVRYAVTHRFSFPRALAPI